MNIGIVTHNFPTFAGEGRAAAGAYVVPLCEELQRRGVSVCVITPDARGAADAYSFPVIRYGGPHAGDKLLGHHAPWNPADMVRLLRTIRSGKETIRTAIHAKNLDVLLALWAFPAGFLCMASGHPKTPFAVWCLGSDIWKIGRMPFVKSLVRRPLAAACRTYADGLVLADEAAELSGKPCSFLPSTRLSLRTYCAPVKEPSGRFRFLFAARWEKAKGVDIYLAAAETVLAKHPNAQCTVFGGGSLQPLVQRHAAALAARFGERFLAGGYLDLSEYTRELARADCVVIPSRIESVPLALTDAVAAKVPVIVSDVGDMAHWVSTYRLGRVVRPGNADDLQKAMAGMIESPYALSEKDGEGFTRVFSIESVAETLLADFASLTK